MKAREVMTSDVVSVRPDMSTRHIAQLLLEKGISAVPVVDDGGAPIGMVSEGDLIGRDEMDRAARRDWWLALLAEGEELDDEFLASLRAPAHTARDVMSSPVITVGEDTSVGEIAQLLADYRVKRVPVVRDGRVVGIVSRADLLRALAQEQALPITSPRGGFLTEVLAGLDKRFGPHPHPEHPQPAEPRRRVDDTGLTVMSFRNLMADFEHEQVEHRDEERRVAADQRRRRVAELIDAHISDESWRALLHRARQAAEHGQKRFLLLRFPSQLCSDGGRAVNIAEPGWPATLRGEAAEIYLRWERDLKPHGFQLSAQVLEFPGGTPGDIGLFLVWAQ